MCLFPPISIPMSDLFFFIFFTEKTCSQRTTMTLLSESCGRNAWTNWLLATSLVRSRCIVHIRAFFSSWILPVTTHPGLSPDSPVCGPLCASQVVPELAFQYRQSIPNSKLPPEVTRRTDCYWGKNCKTQNHNLAHAKKLNHICEQVGIHPYCTFFHWQLIIRSQTRFWGKEINKIKLDVYYSTDLVSSVGIRVHQCS